MLQAVATLLFAAIAALATGIIGFSLAVNWCAIRTALGFATPSFEPAPLPPRYRAMETRRATIMTVREAPGLRAAA